MVEPTARIRDGDGRQCPCNGVIEGGSGPRVSVPPVRFELRPAALNRRHIRRVGWQIQHLSAPTWSIASRMPAALWACRLSIITMSTGRSMGRAPAPHRCGRSRHRWRRQSSSRPRRLSSPAPPPWSRSPVVLWDSADDAFPAGGPTIQTGQREVYARCIDEPEARGVERRDLILLGRACLPAPFSVALISVERLWLRGSSRWRTIRPMVGTFPCRPCCASSGVARPPVSPPCAHGPDGARAPWRSHRR